MPKVSAAFFAALLSVPALLAGALFSAAPAPAQEVSGGALTGGEDLPIDPVFITLGTGPVTGLYYPAGGAIQRLFNRDHADEGLRIAVESTSGTAENLEKLRLGQLDLAIIQSDWQYHAWNGTGPLAGVAPMEDLRSLFSLHDQSLTVLVRADAGIADFDGLAGKRINLGPEDSPGRDLFADVMEEKGWTEDSFQLTTEFGWKDQARALCDGDVDALILLSAHPVAAVQEASLSCQARLIPLPDDLIEKVTAARPWISRVSIPGNLYWGNIYEIPSLGYRATLVARADVSSAIIDELCASVFDNFEDFRAQHPALSGLTAKEMAEDGRTAPAHDGALAYFHRRRAESADGPWSDINADTAAPPPSETPAAGEDAGEDAEAPAEEAGEAEDPPQN
jgi:TRAP transporter TAXI family solute receptor